MMMTHVGRNDDDNVTRMREARATESIVGGEGEYSYGSWPWDNDCVKVTNSEWLEITQNISDRPNFWERNFVSWAFVVERLEPKPLLLFPQTRI